MYVCMYMCVCVCIYIYIYTYIYARALARLPRHLYGGLTIISPTVIYTALEFKTLLNFAPLARHVFKQNTSFSEGIVGETIVKSPFES